MSVITGALPSAPGLEPEGHALLMPAPKGVGALDSLGCKVVAMRTVAVDPS